MIFDNSKLGVATVMIVATGFLGAASPVFAIEIIPTASAQSEAVNSALETLDDQEVRQSPREQLRGVLGVLMAQVDDLKTSLSAIRGLNEDQLEKRGEYLDFLKDAEGFILALQIDAESADVKFIAEELQDWRERHFNPGVKNIVDFSLVFQVQSVLKIAEARYAKIHSDVGRLEDLNILQDSRGRSLLSESRLLLTGAANLRDQAEELLTDGEEEAGEIRQLLSGSITKIRLVYKKFLEISQLVREALK